MERIFNEQVGVRFIGEYVEGIPVIRDEEMHTPKIYTAIRLEIVGAKVRPVKSLQEITSDQRDNISSDVAYLVRGRLIKNGREMVVTLDTRQRVSARVNIPVARQAFFTDAHFSLGGSRFVANEDRRMKPDPIDIPNGERPTPPKETMPRRLVGS